MSIQLNGLPQSYISLQPSPTQRLEYQWHLRNPLCLHLIIDLSTFTEGHRSANF